MMYSKKVCVVIPCFKVNKEIKNVLKKINFKIVDKVYLIDDACPEGSGYIAKSLNFKKVEVIFSKKNLGVGGATMLGFKKALKKNYELIFKIDGDGQHNPKDIVKFLDKLKKNNINFCKGTRLKSIKEIKKIPKIRLYGNYILTYICRINCRNFLLTDAVNGFFGVKSSLLRKINFSRISNDFFFEEDLLYHISYFDKNIEEVNIKVVYYGKSSLSPLKTIPSFLAKHLRNFFERIIYDLSK